MAQALMEMGYGHGKDSINKWRLAERKILEQICNRHEINIAPPKRGRGHTFTVDEYKEREELLKEIQLLTETKNELAEKLKAYENMEVAVEKVEVIGNKMPLGKTLISTADLDLLKEQSKAYCANKSRIDTIGEKEAEAEKSKHRAGKEWLAAREEKQKYEQKNREAESLYNQQLDLNKRHEWATSRIREMAEEKKSATDKLQAEIQALSEIVENQKKTIAQAESNRISSVNQATADLTKKITDLEGELTAKDKLITELKEAQQGAYYSVASVVNAARMLKYGDDDYKVNSLSPKQGILIDSMTDYAVYWARKDGLPDIADEMRQTLISEGLQDKINARTPKVYTGRKIG
jgi:DNA repair exonuclease SbcCD ATPase subunit